MYDEIIGRKPDGFLHFPQLVMAVGVGIIRSSSRFSDVVNWQGRLSVLLVGDSRSAHAECEADGADVR